MTDDAERGDPEAEDARRVLEQAFPGSKVAEVAKPERGNRKQTTVATFVDGERVVVQIAPLATIQTEATLTYLLATETTLPVPTILAAGTIDNRGYVVTDVATGTDLHTEFAALPHDRQRAICRQFGAGLAAVHDLAVFERCGPVAYVGDWERFVTSVGGAEEAVASREGARGAVTPADFAVVADADTLPGRTPSDSWQDWFRAYATAGLDALPTAFDDLQDRLREAIEADLASVVPEAPPVSLYPWDFRPGNALVADGEVTAVLDWGEPLAADPALSVAKAEHLVADWYVASPEMESLRAAFRRGYESVRSHPPIPTAYRIAAVAVSAVDSRGVVTRPRYPELTGDDAVAFHRERLLAALDAGENEQGDPDGSNGPVGAG